MSQAQTFELLTPCFCAGISKDQPEMRVASIRGQLRWWSRLLLATGVGTSEYDLFGGIHGTNNGRAAEGVASSFKLSLKGFSNNGPSEFASLVPHKPGNGYNAKSLPAGSRYTLEWAPPPHPGFQHQPGDEINGYSRLHYLEQAMKAWLLLGTIGRRSTRAAGSVWPVSYKPTVDEFNAVLATFSLSPSVRVAVLNAATPNPTDAPEELRAIADKTIHRPCINGHQGTTRGVITGDTLGYVDRADRKASPLRFKVGRFADGHRLIAIWDNRNGRGGSLAVAKVKMLGSYAGSQLEGWLTAAGY